MGWVIALLVLLVIVAAVGVVVLFEILRLQREGLIQLVRLRRETAHGLGYEIVGPEGDLDGGFLREVAEDIRERRAKERKQRREEEDADEWYRITSGGAR